jgi:hypothetical protein
MYYSFFPLSFNLSDTNVISMFQVEDIDGAGANKVASCLAFD